VCRYDEGRFLGGRLLTGKVIAHFTVAEKLGAGGMGEVYRASDSRLGREVALKVLPEAFAFDADRMARFEREARMLAALNHPHIAAIYGLEDAGGVRCLVLELVEGETLAERIQRGPIPLEEVVEIAGQIAEALETAHERGIIHRDLKPANIKVMPSGKVKVLDFGLAKIYESEATITDLSKSPTLTTPATRLGVVMGTAAYMSPEQARGREVDKRTDIFAYGCVLFEMLAGKQAFPGETVSDTMAAILKVDPEWKLLPASTPPSLLRLLRRCLEKDPKVRLRDIGEARIALAEALSSGGEAPAVSLPAAPRSSLRARAMWLAASVLLATLAGVAAWMLKPTVAPPLRKFEIAVEGLSVKVVPVLSPNGRMLAYVAANQLWVRELDKLEARPLQGTAGATHPFWSPDSVSLGYLANGKLWRIPVGGGEAAAITDPGGGFVGGGGATWGEDGTIVYARGTTGLFSVSDRGGDPKILVPLAENESDFHEPSWLPGGKGLLFVIHARDRAPDTLALSSGGKRSVLLRLEGTAIWEAAYSPTGHILFGRAGANAGVWALPFSLSSLKATGEPFLVLAGAGSPSVSREGTLSCLRVGGSGQQHLVWVGRDGKVEPAGGQPQPLIAVPMLSPDGTRAAVGSNENQNVDVWIHDLKRNTRTRLTFDPGADMAAVWSPKGNQIIYVNQSRRMILAKASDGTGNPEELTEGDQPSVSGNGSALAFVRQGKDTGADIWYMPLAGERKPISLLATAADEIQPHISPDGRYLAYVSNESGKDETYLTHFPSGQGKWQVSVNLGLGPRWSRKGDKLFYRNGSNELMEVDVSLGAAAPVLGDPHKLFAAEVAGVLFGGPFQYDVSLDGRRFLMTQTVGQENKNTRITVIQSWAAEFQERK